MKEPERTSAAAAATGPRGRIIYWTAVAACFAALAFQLAYHSLRTSATVDEPAHILAGYRHLQCGDFGINPEHPPLAKILAALPLRFRAMEEPPMFECGARLTTKQELFLYGPKFVVQNGLDETVVPARLAVSVLALLLAAGVFAAARRMFGDLEALTALAILVFEPNVVANATLVTTDLAIAATAFGAVVAVYFLRLRPGPLRFCLAGLAVGLMFASKHTAVVFVPIIFALVIADALVRRSAGESWTKTLVRPALGFAGVCLIGLAVLWAFYGFRYRAVPNADAPRETVANYIAVNGRPEMTASFSARIATLFGEAHVFPESYMLGVADVVASGSRNMFLFDRGYPTGKWFYFPVSFAIKSSVALLVLIPAGLVFLVFAAGEKRRAAAWLVAPALAYFAVAMTSQLNIGVRHILPVYPFLIVVAAAGAVALARKSAGVGVVLAALVVYHAAATLALGPDTLAFSNVFWGGPSNTHRYFRDPNLDNGQNLKFVREYVERNGLTNCWTALSNNVAITLASQPCRVMPGSFPLSISDEPREPIPPVIEGTVILAAMSMPPRGGDEYRAIIETQPVDRIANGVFVYRGRFEIPLAAALSHVERANQFVLLGRFDDAVADGRQAVAHAPADARVHLALGTALARAGLRDEAQAELARTIEIARTNPGLFRLFEFLARQELKRLEAN